ncbi:MAG: hypothetical protein JSV60_10285 [Desulfobacterales bacterium]|nr:MAG: hypothetical protein JSV60_10285 [Desulfobacterales bacterium]
MTKLRFHRCLVLVALIISTCPNYASAWYDETHIAIAKAAGYYKWFNATGADMAKIKAGEIEAHNHYCNQARGTVVTPQTVLSQVGLYNQIDEKGHLYGAIVAPLRDYIADTQQGRYAEYHLAFCAHYVGDLSQPLHNTLYRSFNQEHHLAVDGIVNDEILDNLDKIKIYPITIASEEELAKEIARIANRSLKLGYKMDAENRLITKEEAYIQISHSASLFRAILKFVGK